VLGSGEADAVEPLRPRPFSSTLGVWRVVAGGRSAVLKLVSEGAGADAYWRSSAEPESAWYWCREPLALTDGLLDRLDGIRPPAVHATVERDDGSLALWLEDLGEPVPQGIERYRAFARALGRAQRACDLPKRPWLSAGFLRAYLHARADVASASPPAGLALWDERDRVLGRLAPATLCHFDLHPGNVFDLPAGFAVIDWAFCGLGAPGEDAGVLVADALLDDFVPPEDGPALAAAVWEGYASGFGDADVDAARYAFLAATPLRYFWLPWRLDGAGRATRPLDDDKADRWRRTFALLSDWADEARELA
jgi:Phosphotransferase enzyme family